MVVVVVGTAFARGIVVIFVEVLKLSILCMVKVVVKVVALVVVVSLVGKKITLLTIS